MLSAIPNNPANKFSLFYRKSVSLSPICTIESFLLTLSPYDETYLSC